MNRPLIALSLAALAAPLLAQDWKGAGRLQGRVTDHLNELDYANVQVYICGNGDMVKGVKDFMQEKGVLKEDLHWEQFTAL